MSNSDYVEQQSEFIDAVNGIGDILVFDTKRKSRNRSTENNLRRLQELAEKFLELEERNTEKFRNLFFSRRFKEISTEDQTEAQFRLSLDPEGYTTAFTSLLDQISRVHEKAIEVENDQISRYTTFVFNWLLGSLTTTADRGLIIKIILKQLRQMGRYAIEQDDSSKYDAVIGWYTGTIFNSSGEEEFSLSYLPLFDKFFFYSVRKIVDEGLEELFDYTVDQFHEGITPRLSPMKNFHNANTILIRTDQSGVITSEARENLESKLAELSNNEGEVDSIEEAIKWKEEFENTFQKLRRELPEDLSEEIDEIEDEIEQSFLDRFKFRNLRKQIWKMCAYCISKEKPQFIKKLWSKDTPEAGVIRAGHTIVPDSLSGVVNQFIDFELYLRRFEPWVDVVNPSRFYRQYFLILLLRDAKSIFGKDRLEEDDVSLTEEISDEFNDIKFNIGDIRKTNHLASAMENLKEDLDVLIDEKEKLITETTSIDSGEAEEIGEKVIKPLFQKIKEEAENKVENVEINKSPDMEEIDQFKEDFLDRYERHATLRDILKEYGSYFEELDEFPDDVDFFGMKRVDHKAAFFDEWHIDYSGWGGQYGQSLGSAENRKISRIIFEHCTEIEKDDFEDYLAEFSELESVIILAEGTSYQSFFRDTERDFELDYSPNSQNELELTSIIGVFEFEGEKIPVFQFHNDEHESEIMMLRRSSFPDLIQYNPLESPDEKFELTDYLKIKIEAYSDNEELLIETLDDPPSWLVEEYEDREEQAKYLKKRVLIEIFERFELDFPEDFQGYKFEA